MASSPLQSDLRPTLLGLPAEIRLRIYYYIIPSPVIEIDLCASRPANDAILPVTLPMPQLKKRKPSILTNLTKHRRNLEVVIKCNYGIQLLSVCRQINAETEPILTASTVRFHCKRCFKDTMENFRYDDGWNINWMRNVEIMHKLDDRLPLVRGMASARSFTAREVMGQCRDVVRERYGRLDLVGKEKWSYLAVREEVEKDQDHGDDTSQVGSLGSQSIAGTSDLQTAAAGDLPNSLSWVIKGEIDLKWSQDRHNQVLIWDSPWSR